MAPLAAPPTAVGIFAFVQSARSPVTYPAHHSPYCSGACKRRCPDGTGLSTRGGVIISQLRPAWPVSRALAAFCPPDISAWETSVSDNICTLQTRCHDSTCPPMVEAQNAGTGVSAIAAGLTGYRGGASFEGTREGIRAGMSGADNIRAASPSGSAYWSWPMFQKKATRPTSARPIDTGIRNKTPLIVQSRCRGGRNPGAAPARRARCHGPAAEKSRSGRKGR